MIYKDKLILKLEKSCYKNLKLKYLMLTQNYNIMIINSIVNNIKNIYNINYEEMIFLSESNEILIKYYKNIECFPLYKRLIELHSKYISIYPNYFLIDINNILMKNILNKQYIINEMYENLIENNSLSEKINFFNEKLMLSELFSDEKTNINNFSTEKNMSKTISKYSLNDNFYYDDRLNQSIIEIERLIFNINKEIKESCNLKEKKDNYLIKNKNNIENSKEKKNTKFLEKKNYNLVKELNNNKYNLKNLKESENENNKKEITIKKTKNFKSNEQFIYEMKYKLKNEIDFKKEEIKIRNKIFKNLGLNLNNNNNKLNKIKKVKK